MAAIFIRSARPDDAAAIAGLLGELGYPSTEDAVQRRLALMVGDPNYALFVAPEDSSPIGFGSAHLVQTAEHDQPVALITALVVTNTARRGGAGKALLEALAEWARDRGCSRVSVTSGLHRPEAHQFYRSCGFEETGKRFARLLT